MRVSEELQDIHEHTTRKIGNYYNNEMTKCIEIISKTVMAMNVKAAT